uniref:Uncharacterized protein n=1 Tax=Graphocephala atropunctata TaxID=36148 RepID=A0A1B6M6K0_9HEMI
MLSQSLLCLQLCFHLCLYVQAANREYRLHSSVKHSQTKTDLNTNESSVFSTARLSVTMQTLVSSTSSLRFSSSSLDVFFFLASRVGGNLYQIPRRCCLSLAVLLAMWGSHPLKPPALYILAVQEPGLTYTG